MLRRTALAAIAVAAWQVTPLAIAEPAVPQPGSSCDPALAGALTKSSGGQPVLECGTAGWVALDTPYPFGARWVTFGPVVKLYGNGRRNAELEPGPWVGTPLGPRDRCTATQVAVVTGVGAGPAVHADGSPGQPLSVTLSDPLFSVEFGGSCVWDRR